MPGNRPGPMKGLPAILAPIEERVGYQGDIAIFDESYERSLINIVPDAIKAAMLRIRHNEPNIFHFTEEKLKKWCKPDPETTMLKLQFWDEYNRAQMDGVMMQVSKFVRGNITREYFYQTVLLNDKQFAWVITPPKDMFTVHREMLYEGLEVEREVLRLPHRRKGVVDHKLIAIKLGIINGLKLRVLGAVAQKLETKSLQVNVNAPKQSLAESTLEELQALESQLERMQKNLGVEEAQQLGPAIEQAEIVEIDAEGEESGS